MSGWRLDFAPRQSGQRWLGNLALALALAGLFWMGRSYWLLAQQQAQSQAQLEQLQQQQKKRQAAAQRPAVELAREQQEMQQAQQVMTRLAFPWQDLFAEIDASVDEQVTLLALEPDVAKQSVQITGEARDLAAMLAYVKRLQNGRVLRQPRLQSHDVLQQHAQRPVRFVLLADWQTRQAAGLAPKE